MHIPSQVLEPSKVALKYLLQPNNTPALARNMIDMICY